MTSRKFPRNLLLLAGVLCVNIALFSGGASAASTAQELDRDAKQALQTLYNANPTAREISKKAKAVLVFPNVIKAGLVFGGAYGEGVMMKGGAVAGYYNSVSASWGLQAGAQSYGYALFIMNDKAMSDLEKTEGWEIGVGPSVVMVNEGVAKNLSSSTLQDDIYGFTFDQQGLMATLSIEGTKVSKIKR